MRNFLYLVLLLLLQMPFLTPGALAQEHLQVTLTEQDYPPLITGGSRPSGLLTEVVRESFKLSNVDVNFVEVSNNRAITGVMQDYYEGSYGWTHSPERDAKLLYSSKPIYSLRIVFFQRTGEEISWNKLTDLRAMKIGVTQGNYYSSEFESLSASGQLVTDSAPSDISNFRKLLIGRVDLFPIDIDTGQYLLKKYFPAAEREKLQFQHKAISIMPIYLVIRRNLPQAKELITRFDRGYQQLIESGQLEKLSEAYKLEMRTQP